MLVWLSLGFSALQRAEIAEIGKHTVILVILAQVSVLFNEPKLLKSRPIDGALEVVAGFSALQRAEIAEMRLRRSGPPAPTAFQCSSTSRNC